jgi:hypothetical protein
LLLPAGDASMKVWIACLENVVTTRPRRLKCSRL